ncbi:MAG: rhodanese-like domain-containing protein [Rhodospirillaceae bacterium]|nr:rhodanese-like domain-containing protein [Rhodospirillaceae bacterium]MBL6932735.1 rhodanese-like domain-containing protein [Rhodospirillales bacterium]
MMMKEVDPVTLKQWMDEGSAVLVDVREPDEHARECIARDHHMPLSNFNPAALPDHDDKIVVYYCASGGRTGMYGPQLAEVTARARQVYHLTGGIMAWKSAGNSVD